MRFKEENDLEKGREVSRFLGYFISFILMNKFLILLNFMTIFSSLLLICVLMNDHRMSFFL